MIGVVREWMTSIVVVTLLLSVAQTLIPEGIIRKVCAFTGGMILLAVLLQPFLETDMRRFRLDFSEYEEVMETRREELENAGERELAIRIAEQTAAYISDKAAAFGLMVTAHVETSSGTDGTPIPSAVELEGTYSVPLMAWIEEELGIPAERQVWNDEI